MGAILALCAGLAIIWLANTGVAAQIWALVKNGGGGGGPNMGAASFGSY